MYYVLAATVALLVFVLFIKALGSVIKGILTTTFVIVVVVFIYVMLKSISSPVNLFGIYQVDNFEITKLE
jgi:hypothetical protein